MGKTTIGEFESRVKFLMNYSLSKTLTENIIKKNYISEQQTLAPVGFDIPGIMNPPKSESELEIEVYKKICGNNEFLLIPGKNKYGAQGADALVKDYTFDENGAIIDEKTRHFCLYKTPSKQTKDGVQDSMWVPSGINIEFFSQESIKNVIDGFLERRKRAGDTDADKKSKELYETFKPGQIKFFVLDSKKFVPYIQYDKNNDSWIFMGYQEEKTNELYQEPIWEDPRNAYEKFIDDNGWVVQIVAGLAIAVAGWSTGGAAWVFYAELGVELLLGAAVGFREWETGQNVACAFSVIFALLPYAKLFKWFRGVKEETFRSLAKKIADSGLTSESDDLAWEAFTANKLSSDEATLLKRVLEADEITKNEIIKEVNKGLNSYIPEKLFKRGLTFVADNPQLFKDEKWIKQLLVREWGFNGLLLFLTIAVENVFGKKLNNEQKYTLETMHAKIPKELQKEFEYNLVYNTNVLPEVANNLEKSVTQYLDSPKHDSLMKKNMVAGIKVLKTKIMKAFKDSTGTYEEISSNYRVGDEVQFNEQEEKDMRSKGWIRKEELTDDLSKKVIDTMPGWVLLNEPLSHPEKMKTN